MTAADPARIFDRRLLRRRRDRAAAGFARHDFLVRHTGGQILDRLLDVRRDFRLVLDLGGRTGGLAGDLIGRKGIERVVTCDLSPAMAGRAPAPAVAGDEELLPFADGTFDLVVSNLSLHWVNDLPGTLLQIRRALKPDGLFLAALLGGDTLIELRRALVEAELGVAGGISPRLSPSIGLADAAALLHRAGFALPVADSDTVTVTYGSAFELFADLRGMGETNATLNRNPAPPPRALWAAAAERYAALFADAEGRLPATFEVIHLTGWSPDASQPKPLRPGSARHRLAEALGTVEQPAGDRAAP